MVCFYSYKPSTVNYQNLFKNNCFSYKAFSELYIFEFYFFNIWNNKNVLNENYNNDLTCKSKEKLDNKIQKNFAVSEKT